MNLKAQTDQVISASVGKHVQILRLKKNMSLEDLAKEAGVSRQTLHLLLNHGRGTLVNLISVLRAINELERLSSLLEDIRPSPLQIIRMEGKKRQRASGRRMVSDGNTSKTSNLKKATDW
jgi:putative transcriptional regulator